MQTGCETDRSYMQTGCETDRQTDRQTDHMCRLDVRQTDRQTDHICRRGWRDRQAGRRAEAGRQIKTDSPKSLKQSKNASCFKETQVHF